VVGVAVMIAGIVEMPIETITGRGVVSHGRVLVMRSLMRGTSRRIVWIGHHVETLGAVLHRSQRPITSTSARSIRNPAALAAAEMPSKTPARTTSATDPHR
jgi:hypothetical protein